MNRRIVVGDIHGCFLTLKALVENQVKLDKTDQLYLLGDYIDRGPRSREVIEYLIQLKWQGYNVFPLKGNHEDMMLRAIQDPSCLHSWFNNGAEETLRSFEIPEPLLFETEGVQLIPERYIAFLSGLPLYYELKDYILVHAGLNLNLPDIFSDHEAMLWNRSADAGKFNIKAKCIVHGHTPMPIVSIRNQIRKGGCKTLNLDGGCVYRDLPGYGYLPAINLENKELFCQENID